MKKILGAVAIFCGLQTVNAQTVSPNTDTTTIVTIESTPQPRKIDVSSRTGDHVMIQFGHDGWIGAPDSIATKGLSRHFNAYFLLDKPFRNNPKMSVAFGVGVSTSNIYFNRRFVDVKSTSARLPFRNLDSADHFKKHKLLTAFLEAPVELRYSSNPVNSNSSFKAAVGLKVGTMIDAHTKSKTLQNRSGQTIENYIAKEKSKKFFNTTRVAATARVGYGVFSIHGSYQITQLLKEGAGPAIRPYSIGITISGL